MSIDSYFGNGYADARSRFLRAADGRAQALWCFPHPDTGPDGEDLAIDIAWLGPRDAEAVVIAGSATHGAEGLCGSGCQVGFLEQDFGRTLPPETALVLVHANNPHGFAHVRRVNEDNIDLNRNFIDFDADIPHNDGYATLHECLVPPAWEGPERDNAEATIEAYIETHGRGAFQQAMSQGQYRFSDGLFYGGTGPSWSRRTLEGFASDELAGAKRIAIVDFHTGLGPRGYGEIIGRGAAGDERYERTRAWYGDEVRSAMAGDSSSVRLNGTIDYGYVRACPQAEVTAITLEFGTLPFEQVSEAVRADNWLYSRGGGAASAHYATIKAQVREAFYGDDSQWRSDIWTRGEAIVQMALAGVSGK